MSEFIINAVLSGAFLSVALALIGTIVVLKRMSFIGAGLSHAAFAGVVLSLITKIPVLIGTLLYNFLASFAILKMKSLKNADSIIGIIFSFSMALGIMLVYLLGINISVVQILFGDILSISTLDVYLAILSSLIIFYIFYKKGKELLYFAFDEEFLKSKGINTELIYSILLFSLALIITISIKLIGILLVSSFLVIPPSTSILLSKNTKQMLFFSAAFSIFSLISGIVVSLIIDIPSGATIVLISSKA